jgi:Protein of unknown function (DUF3047)
MGMKVLLLLFLCGTPLLAHAAGEPATDSRRISLDNFDTDQPLAFPRQWKARGSEEVARVVYQVAEENGNRFLHAHAEKQDEQIGISRSFQPKEFPVLQWRWRAKQLPAGGNEQATNTNDSAAGVYVVFDNTVLPRAIKYVWSSTLPVGTRFTSPVYRRSRTVVLQSGPGQVNEWKLEMVNFYSDYKELFGEEPGEVQGIAILTDSDGTKSVAEADYDDFTLLSSEAAATEEGNRTTARLAPATAGGQ